MNYLHFELLTNVFKYLLHEEAAKYYSINKLFKIIKLFDTNRIILNDGKPLKKLSRYETKIRLTKNDVYEMGSMLPDNEYVGDVNLGLQPEIKNEKYVKNLIIENEYVTFDFSKFTNLRFLYIKGAIRHILNLPSKIEYLVIRIKSPNQMSTIPKSIRYLKITNICKDIQYPNNVHTLILKNMKFHSEKVLVNLKHAKFHNGSAVDLTKFTPELLTLNIRKKYEYDFPQNIESIYVSSSLHLEKSAKLLKLKHICIDTIASIDIPTEIEYDSDDYGHYSGTIDIRYAYNFRMPNFSESLIRIKFKQDMNLTNLFDKLPKSLKMLSGSKISSVHLTKFTQITHLKILHHYMNHL